VVVIPFEPLIIQLGPWVVRLFGVLALMGLGSAVVLTLRQARQEPATRAAIARAVAWGIPSGIVMARLTNVLSWWDFYFLHAQLLPSLAADGLSLWGGLVGGGVVAAAALRHDPALRTHVFNLAAPGVALGIAIGRLGQFLDGYGQGFPSALPWATQYTSRLMATPDFGVPRHPVQLYDGLIALGLFFVLQRTRLEWRARTLLIVYAAASLALAPLKLEPPFLFGVQIGQVLAAAALLTGLSLAMQSSQRARARTASRAAA
jgi:phosphatidylglycerol:prolipoprotein diacylglycerol transferase